MEFSAIKAKSVRKAGGLIIILDGLQSARRLEKQLRGRAGRLGDPGETHHFVSMEEPVFHTFSNITSNNLISVVTNKKDTKSLEIEDFIAKPIIQKQLIKMVQQCQQNIERYHRGIRRETANYGDVLHPYMLFNHAWKKSFI